MKTQLMQLQILLTFVDPELANYLGTTLKPFSLSLIFFASNNVMGTLVLKQT